MGWVMTDKKLKSCPFCGSQPPNVFVWRGEHGCWVVACDVCDCEGPTRGRDSTESSAVDSWNNRPIVTDEEKARRAKACINACAGIKTETLEAMGSGLVVRMLQAMEAVADVLERWTKAIRLDLDLWDSE